MYKLLPSATVNGGFSDQLAGGVNRRPIATNVPPVGAAGSVVPTRYINLIELPASAAAPGIP